MNCVETPLLIPLQGDTLIGVLAAPPGPAASTAVLVVVGGPQTRVGSHRLFVHLARHLAAQGHAVLRFDVRGMGDSSGLPAGFEHQHDDIAAALSALQEQRPEVRRVVLWGLCDGASAALLYVQRAADPRVGGLVLLNPWVRSPQTLARAHLRHYYLQRMRQPGFWRKLLVGKVGPGALRDWLHNVRTARQTTCLAAQAPFAERMAQGWRSCKGPLLLVLSGNDITAQEFAGHAVTDAAWTGALRDPRLTRVDVPDADHTLSNAACGQQAIGATLDWLRLRFADADAGAGAGAGADADAPRNADGASANHAGHALRVAA